MAVAALIIGGGLMAASQIQEGRIAEAQGRFQKKIALRNQQELERQAKAESVSASLEESRIARKEKIVKARQRATVGKTGIGLAGATLAVLTDTAFQFSMDRNLALRRGVIRGRELIERGRIIAAQGRFAKTVGTQAQRLSYFKAGGSILGAIGTAGFLKAPATTGTTTGTFGTTPAFTTSQRFSTFSGGGTVIPR